MKASEFKDGDNVRFQGFPWVVISVSAGWVKIVPSNKRHSLEDILDNERNVRAVELTKGWTS